MVGVGNLTSPSAHISFHFRFVFRHFTGGGLLGVRTSSCSKVVRLYTRQLAVLLNQSLDSPAGAF